MKIVLIRPDFDHATKYASHWFKVLKNALAGHEVVDLYASAATKENVLREIEDAEVIVGTGHGSPEIFSAQDMEYVFVAGENESAMRGKKVFLNSCYTSRVLGRNAIQRQTQKYVGYANEFVWITQTSNPETDSITTAFRDCTNTIALSLINGESTGEIMQTAQRKFDEWIQTWSASNGFFASLVVQHLIFDRDNFEALDEASATQEPPEYVESFESGLQEPPKNILSAVIPILIGVATLAVIKK